MKTCQTFAQIFWCQGPINTIVISNTTKHNKKYSHLCLYVQKFSRGKCTFCVGGWGGVRCTFTLDAPSAQLPVYVSLDAMQCSRTRTRDMTRTDQKHLKHFLTHTHTNIHSPSKSQWSVLGGK